jgi:hypothetical protein
MTSCDLQVHINDSEKYPASIFRVELEDVARMTRNVVT